MSLVGLLQAASVVTVLFSFLTGFDIPNRYLELFAHFRLQYLVASILLLMVFVWLRSPAYGAALFVGAVFNATFIFPMYFEKAQTSSGQTLKLIHVNVLSTNKEYSRLLEFVADENPDMVFLQEVTSEWDIATRPLLRDFPYSYSEPRLGNFGIAVYSKLPLDTVRHIDSPPLEYPTIVATMTAGSETITLISSHPTIPLSEYTYNARNEQLDSIVELLNQVSGAVVLLGDFNASPWDVHYRKLENGTGLRSVRQGFGVLPTWPTFMPFAMIPIDHALVSDGIGIVEARTGRRIGSDHLPLVVTLTLKSR